MCWRYYKIKRALPAFLAQVKAASERMNEHKEGPPIGSNSIHRVICQLFKRAPLSRAVEVVDAAFLLVRTLTRVWSEKIIRSFYKNCSHVISHLVETYLTH